MGRPEDNPCFACPDKDYASGCDRGCTRRAGYLAAVSRRAEERRKAAIATQFLAEGAAKAMRRR